MVQIMWPNSAKLALSLVVNVEEGAEARIDDGDKRPEPVDELGIAIRHPIRNYGNESNYAYGIKAGAPRVMRLLEQHGMRATFTAAAQALERAPDLTRQIVAQGHEVCSHGWRWVHQFSMDESAEHPPAADRGWLHLPHRRLFRRLAVLERRGGAGYRHHALCARQQRHEDVDRPSDDAGAMARLCG